MQEQTNILEFKRHQTNKVVISTHKQQAQDDHDHP